MKSAIYHQAAPAQSVSLVVIAENENGTVDLARTADGPAIVKNCRVVESEEVGACSYAREGKAKK